MSFAKSQPYSADRGDWDNATAYATGDRVDYAALSFMDGVNISFVAKQPNTGQAPTLDPADANWALSHALDGEAFFNTLLSLVLSVDFMPPGQVWTHAYTADYRLFNRSHEGSSTRHELFYALLEAPGYDGSRTLNMGIGLQYNTNVTPATRNIYLHTFTARPDPLWLPTTGPNAGLPIHRHRGDWASGTDYYKGDVIFSRYHFGSRVYFCTTDHNSNDFGKGNSAVWSGELAGNDARSSSGYFAFSQTAPQTFGAHKVWNGGTGDIPFWISANGARLIWVTRSNLRYHLSYFGSWIVLGNGDEYAYPFLGAPPFDSNANDAYDSTAYNFPINTSAQNGTYPYGAAMTRQLNWRSLQPLEHGNNRWRCFPFDQYRVNQYGVDPQFGHYALHDGLLFFGGGNQDNPSTEAGFVGSLDGLFWVPNNGLVSENTITVGADTYTVFENVNRGESGGYVALKHA